MKSCYKFKNKVFRTLRKIRLGLSTETATEKQERIKLKHNVKHKVQLKYLKRRRDSKYFELKLQSCLRRCK